MQINTFNQQYEKLVIEGLPIKDLFSLAQKKAGKEPENREPTTDDLMSIAFDWMIEVSPIVLQGEKLWDASYINTPLYIYQIEKELSRAVLMCFLLMPPVTQESVK